MFGKTVLLIILGIAAYKDWREQQISLYLPACAGVAGLLIHMMYREQTLAGMTGGAGIGLAALAVAWCSKESIGMGDGLMIMATGVFLGFWGNLELFTTALFLIGGASLFLITVKRKKRDYRVPFLPFLLAAYLFQLG